MDRLNELLDERRSNLKKYYKRVLICSVCQKLYGSDQREDTGSCPPCLLDMVRKKAVKHNL